MRARKNERIPILNFDNFVEEMSLPVSKQLHGLSLPVHVRSIIAGPSCCGKSNLLLNLIFAENGLTFSNIYIFSKTLHQPKYRLLESVLSGIEGMGYFPFHDYDEVQHPNDILPHSVMIFDDVSTQKQGHIRDYFTMGRHNYVDVFYLTQTFSKVPKQLIRDNANFIIVFKQDEMNLKHIYDDYVNTDMCFSKFKQLCQGAWKDKNGFLTIHREAELDKRYRIMLDSPIKIST